ncbi:hypothetical protein PILCRDRAFT_810171 [Piloderma croceum F 1598]|uniref:Uncharacterized protein n=1 Tax=Piloderma croceum (strain F 1598) TaxID=765440 RepID=A0A0C3CR89_PILCF|nr:hypothetical protein PILCRDRAFT_810171 [Piloderma croceum F 1598]
MYSKLALVSLLAFSVIDIVHATLYVINPQPHSACQASKSCTVQWLDDGLAPLLSDIGVCSVGLYTGREKLVQTLSPVDVSATQSLTFEPDGKAGPDSDTYYIAFTSATLNNTNGTGPYQEFSPAFSLTHMSGTFASPVASDTSTKSIPSSLFLQHQQRASTHPNTTTVKYSASSTQTSSSSSNTPSLTTPLVFPTPSGTISSDSNKNSASRLHTPIPVSLISVSAILLLSAAALG